MFKQFLIKKMKDKKINMIFVYILLFQIFQYYCSDIIVFNSKNYRAGHFAFNSQGDMIIEYSKNKDRLFYGLKSDGKYYFKDDSQNKVPTKEITLEYGTNDVKRYEAKNIFVTIDNKEYLFSIAVDSSVVELFDLNEGNSITYKINLPENFIGTRIYSYVFSLLDMNTEQKQYLISYYVPNNYNLKKFQFFKFGLDKSNSGNPDYSLTTSNDPYVATNLANRIVSCFIMDSEIVVFLLAYDKKYILFIYDFNLVAQNIGNTPEIDQLTNYNAGYGVFSKAYHLENRDAIFIYFTSPNSNALKLKTGTINENKQSFTEKIAKNINEYDFNYEVRLNDFVKIDSKRFVYIGLPNDNSNSAYIILFDLYNNYQSMNMRIYQENFDNSHILDKELSADVYNGYLIFTSTCNSESYSIFMIFGYANKTDDEIDISEYFMDDNENNQNNLINKLLENVNIENNIFQYHLITTEIKLKSIPTEIRFYNKEGTNEILIANEGNLKTGCIFKQNQDIEKTDDFYYLDYQPILEEPSYSNYNDGTIKNVEFNKLNDDYENNYVPKRYYGRSVTVKFKLCHQYCEKCKKFGYSNNNQFCLSCLENYRYFYDKQFNLNCVPFEHFYDNDQSLLTVCDDTNSKFYINLTDHRKICFKSNLPCPEEYSYYNETSKECLNYTPPTTIISSIPEIDTTIFTTIPDNKAESTIPLVPSTIELIPSTIQNIPSTIITTIPKTMPIYPFICTYDEFLKEKCSFQNMDNTEIYNKIKKELMSSYPPNGESIVIHGVDNYVFQVTNNLNELSTINGSLVNGYNLSMIDLALCEQALKDSNIINDNTILNLLKFEKLSDLSIEKNIQYELYTINSSEKLNLSICKDKPVDIYIPIELSEDTKIKYEDLKKQGYDLFDKNSSFYTDICTPYDSPNGTDVSLSTRNSEFYNSTETSCQKNCEYGDYSSDTSFLKCVCSVVQDDIETVKPEKYTGMTFLLSFYDVLRNSNYEMVKCYGLVLRLVNFIVNIGSIIVIVLFLFYLIFMVVYMIKGISKLKIEISKVLSMKDNNNINIRNNLRANTKNFDGKKNKNNSDKKPKKHSTQIIKKDKGINKKRSTIKPQSDKNLINPKNNNLLNNESIRVNKIIKKNSKKNSYPPKKSIKTENSKINIIKNDITINKFSKESNMNLDVHKSILTNKFLLENPNHNKKSKSIINNNLPFSIIPMNPTKNDYIYSNMELNEMEYLEAIENDKRSFCQMYWSLLSREHLIIFTFCLRNDYNIFSVKLSRFFFFVCTDMAMNVFFFTDESMNKIYKSYGKWDILENIPQILYSLLISQAVQIFICFLTLTDKHYYTIKRLKFSGENNIVSIFKILRCIKIKLVIFYVFTFIIFLVYWYIITSFCAVYKNTQIIFIKDSLSSFLLGLLYPFVLYIFPTLLRIISLKSKKKNLSCLYKFSDFIPIF